MKIKDISDCLPNHCNDIMFVFPIIKEILERFFLEEFYAN